MEPKCDGCGGALHPVWDYGYTVCMPCTAARAQAVARRGRCACGRKRVPGEVKSVGSRSWIPCKRCLGQIAQIS